MTEDNLLVHLHCLIGNELTGARIHECGVSKRGRDLACGGKLGRLQLMRIASGLFSSYLRIRLRLPMVAVSNVWRPLFAALTYFPNPI